MRICEVGPRDGLQNESLVLGPETRAELINRLQDAGVRRIEAVSFVNPKAVPAMDEPDRVLAGVRRVPGAVYSGLVLNERGYDRAIAAGVDEIHYGLACTDEFGMRNQRQTSADGVRVGREIVRRARRDGKPVTVIFMVAFGCPFAGRVDPKRVLGLVEEVLLDPPDEIGVADTIGVGVPTQVTELVTAVRGMGAAVGAHFHNTRNTGYANAVAAVEAGVVSLDASVGGTGGCPFAPRATGNIATEDLVYMLHGMGIQTGIDPAALIEVTAWLGSQLGKELPGLFAKAGPFP